MADLLTHVLVAYAVLTVASWRVGWLTDRWIVVGMGGAIVPDLTRLRLLMDDARIADALGVPFTYEPISTVGGVLFVAIAVTVLFERQFWRRVYGLVVVGAMSHLVLDGMRVWVDGRADAWFFPFLSAWRPPTPSLYVSSNPIVPVIGIGIALVVFVADRTIVKGRSRQIET